MPENQNDYFADKDILFAILEEKNKNAFGVNLPQNNLVFLYGVTGLGKFVHNLLHEMGRDSFFITDNCLVNNDDIWTRYRIINDISAQEKGDSVILICQVDIPFRLLHSQLQSMGFVHVLHCYEYLFYFFPEAKVQNGWFISNLSEPIKKSIISIYNFLADEPSRKSFLNVLSWRVMRAEIFDCDTLPAYREMFPDFLTALLGTNEVFIDCGAYIGNTIWYFLQCVDGEFDTIVAYEPNPRNFAKLKENCRSFMTDKQFKRTRLICLGVSNDGQKRKILSRGAATKIIDSDFNDVITSTIDDTDFTSSPSIIKIHIEGDELCVLEGAVNKIQRYRPIIIVAVYHSEKDFFGIPLWLNKNLSNYRFYLRLYRYYGQSEFMYAIPEERFLQEI